MTVKRRELIVLNKSIVKKNVLKGISTTLTACMLFGMGIGQAKASAAAVCGDVITFGSYEQDGDTENGKEPIEWLVVSVNKNQALLLSRYVLAPGAYHEKMSGTTWEKSSLRKWLNTDFIKEAFSEKEQKVLTGISLKNKDNEEYGTAGGGNTKDYVFLLSSSEAMGLLGDQSFSIDEDPFRGYATEAAIEEGLYVVTKKDIQDDPDRYSIADKDTCGWWLRTPGAKETWAAIIETDGSLDLEGGYVYCEDFGIRPAACVDLEKLNP